LKYKVEDRITERKILDKKIIGQNGPGKAKHKSGLAGREARGAIEGTEHVSIDRETRRDASLRSA
jgi:hypothetical protein